MKDGIICCEKYLELEEITYNTYQAKCKNCGKKYEIQKWYEENE